MVNSVEQLNSNTVNKLYHITLKVKNCNRIADTETLIPSKPHLGEACCVHKKKPTGSSNCKGYYLQE